MEPLNVLRILKKEKQSLCPSPDSSDLSMTSTFTSNIVFYFKCLKKNVSTCKDNNRKFSLWRSDELISFILRVSS